MKVSDWYNSRTKRVMKFSHFVVCLVINNGTWENKDLFSF